jgi:hypothetical protein
MEESVSGFELRGSWADVVEHGERVARALRDVGAHEDDQYDDALAEFEEWRPKSHERLDEDVNEKTAAQASVDEGEGERAGRDPDEDIQSAGERIAESYEKLGEDHDDAVDKWSESIDYVARAADSAGRKALRSVEGAVYRKVMTRIAPYYFDNALVSANVRAVDRTDGEFALEVNVNDDEYKSAVSDRLGEYESIDRWHVDTEKNTETAEAAEGVDPPEETDPGDPATN